MLSVLLKILAVIGVILLILLGITICLLLIVLFVPISYRIYGDFKPDKMQVEAKIKWLMGLIRLNVAYSEKLTLKFYFLWFDLKGCFQKKNNKPTDTVFEKNIKSVKISSAETMSDETHATKVNAEELTTEESKFESEEKKEDIDPLENPLSEKRNNLIFKIKSIYDKLKTVWNNISYYINLIQEEDTKVLAAQCFGVLGKIIFSIRPRKLKIQGIMGLDSPDTTGKIYGLLCMLYPYYGKNIHIIPDFENKILEGSLFCKGRIYGCILFINALRILLNKKIFKVIHKFKNGGKQRDGR